jgi:hypothetical protein
MLAILDQSLRLLHKLTFLEACKPGIADICAVDKGKEIE